MNNSRYYQLITRTHNKPINRYDDKRLDLGKSIKFLPFEVIQMIHHRYTTTNSSRFITRDANKLFTQGKRICLL